MATPNQLVILATLWLIFYPTTVSNHYTLTYTSCWQRNHCGGICSNDLKTTGMQCNGIVCGFCVTLEIGQGSTGCCCIAHCVHHERASLRLVVNCNKVNTCEHTLTWPLPWDSDTCVVCCDFSSHSNWCGDICAMTVPPSHCLTESRHAHNFFTSNQHLHLAATLCDT